jgi:hypothetical protein
MKPQKKGYIRGGLFGLTILMKSKTSSIEDVNLDGGSTSLSNSAGAGTKWKFYTPI